MAETPLSTNRPYVGRLAPSPTGYLHLGNARTLAVTWLRARAAGGTVVLRMEDLNYPRVSPETVRGTYEDLRWLGLDWDFGPPDSRPRISPGPHEPYVQSQRLTVYHCYLDRLGQAGLVYPCVCTRKDILAALNAPHEGEEVRYPNTCRGRFANHVQAQAAAGRNAALRMRVEPGLSTVADAFLGTHTLDLFDWSGDFVVLTRQDQLPSYHLAVVADDIEMGVTEIVRGADLLPTTHRHLALYAAFGATVPRYVHLPLVRDAGGRRLAKRDGDTRIAHIRQRGLPPERVIGWLAYTCGHLPRPAPLSAAEWLAMWNMVKVPREEVRISAADRAYLGLDDERA